MTRTKTAPEAAKVFHELGVSHVLIKCGEKGCYCSSPEFEGQIPALAVKTVDTTGAGDCFGGCSLHYVLKYGLDNFDEDKLKELLTFANGAASIVTTRKGALCVMPEEKEVLDFIG